MVIDFKGARGRRSPRMQITLANGKTYRRVAPGEWQGFVVPTSEGRHSPHWRRPSAEIVRQLEKHYLKGIR